MTAPSEYVMAAIDLIPVAYNLWNLPGVVRLRTRAGRELPPPTPPEPVNPVPSASSAVPVADVAAGLLRALPPGAVAHYEGPDGSQLTVWWITAPPATGGGPEEYALW
ncbi:hypothetical protein ACIRL3_15720 [Streptomyces sp. NPDC102384]|uniref:hypothetical protein n=1 Tax=Streptomyces sp. NPDC102384 TaxID=3366166 RepID=UPI00380AE1C4